jgi:TolA-binding protein
MTMVQGCSSMRKETQETPADGDHPVSDTAALREASMKDMSTLVNSLNTKVQTLEDKVATLNDRLSAAHSTIDNLNQEKGKAATAGLTPADQAGVSPSEVAVEGAPKASFVSDNSIEKYRNALILFEAGKLPEAMLEFNQFLNSNADHAFAGGAQYYIGECYFRQNEFKLAHEEYLRVLSAHEHSSFVPDALKRLTQVEDRLKLAQQSAKHKQLLLSLFPQSPAARDVLEAKVLSDTVEAVTAETAKSAARTAKPARGGEKPAAAQEKFPAIQGEPAIPTAAVPEDKPEAPAHTE